MRRDTRGVLPDGIAKATEEDLLGEGILIRRRKKIQRRTMTNNERGKKETCEKASK